MFIQAKFKATAMKHEVGLELTKSNGCTEGLT